MREERKLDIRPHPIIYMIFGGIVGIGAPSYITYRLISIGTPLSDVLPMTCSMSIVILVCMLGVWLVTRWCYRHISWMQDGCDTIYTVHNGS